jgi:hypothetical protein
LWRIKSCSHIELGIRSKSKTKIINSFSCKLKTGMKCNRIYRETFPQLRGKTSKMIKLNSHENGGECQKVEDCEICKQSILRMLVLFF